MAAVKEGINALVWPGGKNNQPLSAPAGKNAIGPGRGSSKTAKSGGSGGGIASPLTEQYRQEQQVINGQPQTSGGQPVMVNVPARQYYTDRTLTSTDGVFTLKVRAIKQMSLMDSADNPVLINFADPVNEPT